MDPILVSGPFCPAFGKRNGIKSSKLESWRTYEENHFESLMLGSFGSGGCSRAREFHFEFGVRQFISIRDSRL